MRPVFDIDVVLLDIGEHRARQAERFVESFRFVGVEQRAVFAGDFVLIGPKLLDRAVDWLARQQAPNVSRDSLKRNGEVFVPRYLIMQEAIFGEIVEPRLTGLFEVRDPALASLGLTQAREDRLRAALAAKRLANVGLDRKFRQPSQFLVWPEHDAFDPGDHASNGLILDFGEGFFAKLEEHHIGAVAKPQHLEMILPDEEKFVDQAMIILNQIPRMRATLALGNDLDWLELFQLAEFQSFHHLERGEHLPF